MFRQVFRCLLETREEPDSGGKPRCVYWASWGRSEKNPMVRSFHDEFDEGCDFKGGFSWLDQLVFLFGLIWCAFSCAYLFVAKWCNFVYDMFVCVGVDCTDTFGDDGFDLEYACVHSCVHGGWFFGESFPLCLLTQEFTWCNRLVDTNSILVSWLS